MNKISLAFALVFFIALSFTGCKSTKKVGTVEAGGAKAHNEFFTLMQEQDCTPERGLELAGQQYEFACGSEDGKRQCFPVVRATLFRYRGFPRRDQCGQRKGDRPYEQALCG